MKVDLYTTYCPRCLTLEKKLNQKQISFIAHTDVDEMLARGYKSAPMLVIDGKELSFEEAIKWVNSLEG